MSIDPSAPQSVPVAPAVATDDVAPALATSDVSLLVVAPSPAHPVNARSAEPGGRGPKGRLFVHPVPGAGNVASNLTHGELNTAEALVGPDFVPRLAATDPGATFGQGASVTAALTGESTITAPTMSRGAEGVSQ